MTRQLVLNGVPQDVTVRGNDPIADDGRDASRAAAFATLRADPYDQKAKRLSVDALQRASSSDSENAAKSHLKAAQHLRAQAEQAMDPNSPVGGQERMDRGLASKLRRAAKAHEDAASVHQLAGIGTGEDEDEDSRTENRRRGGMAQVVNMLVQAGLVEEDNEEAARSVLEEAGVDNPTAVINRRAAFNALRIRLEHDGRRAVRNAQRRRQASITANTGDVLDFGRPPSMRSIVNQQRRRENKALNYGDGSGGSYPAQYDLPRGMFDPGSMLSGSPLDGRFDVDLRAGSGAKGGADTGRDPGDEGAGDQYDPDGYWTGMKQAGSVPGIQLLDPHEQQAADMERARMMGLDYMPEDEYQLRTPATMMELLQRERYEGHTVNAYSDDPDVLVMNGFDAREAQALQRGFGGGGRRRR